MVEPAAGGDGGGRPHIRTDVEPSGRFCPREEGGAERAARQQELSWPYLAHLCAALLKKMVDRKWCWGVGADIERLVIPIHS